MKTTGNSGRKRLASGSKSLCTTIALMSLLAGSAFDLPNARAQNKESPPRTEPSAAEAKGYDLEIHNGMLLKPGSKTSGLEALLKHVIDRLRESYPQANIALPPSLGDVPIGDLKLRTGSLWDELEAVRVASGGKFEWKGPGFPIFFAGQENQVVVPTQAIDPATGLPVKNPDFPNAGLFVLREARPTPETERVIEAINIGPYLDWLAETRAPEWGLNPSHPDYKRKVQVNALNEGLKQIKEILGTTVAKFNKGRTEATEQPDFEFHEGARLLVVIGTRETVDIARKVVGALPGQSAAANPISQPGSGASEDAFRRRYGLGPSGSARTPGTPSQAQPPPATPGQHP